METRLIVDTRCHSQSRETVGIIYLENNPALTTDRREILQLLSGQAAIAIANARLYRQK